MPSRSSIIDEERQSLELYSLLKEANFEDEADDDVDGGNHIQLAAAGCTLWALQLVWSTIFARGTAYLAAINIPLSLSAFLWISCPFCGMVVQPIMGALSDSYEPKRTGRNKRKPFILVGAIATAISMTGLAWIPDIVVLLVQIFGEEYEVALLIINATVWVWALSVSVQPLQGGVRTLLHEICSKEAQARFTAYQGVLVAFGTVSGYLLASVSFGDRPGARSAIWQFQILTLVISVILLVCSAITVLYPYPSPRKKAEGAASQYSVSLKHALKRNIHCLKSLPRSVQLTLQVQFFSWLGWFPALYYQASYLASLYSIGRPSGNLQPTNEAEHAAFDSMPHTFFMFTTAVLMAAMSQWACTSSKRGNLEGKTGSLTTLVNIWLGGHALFAMAMASQNPTMQGR
ncbi:hypothetical protein BST61_g3359 [Cercospora zeina]